MYRAKTPVWRSCRAFRAKRRCCTLACSRDSRFASDAKHSDAAALANHRTQRKQTKTRVTFVTRENESVYVTIEKIEISRLGEIARAAIPRLIFLVIHFATIGRADARRWTRTTSGEERLGRGSAVALHSAGFVPVNAVRPKFLNVFYSTFLLYTVHHAYIIYILFT